MGVCMDGWVPVCIPACWMRENYRYVTVCEDNGRTEALSSTTQLGERRQQRGRMSAGVLQECGESGEREMEGEMAG